MLALVLALVLVLVLEQVRSLAAAEIVGPALPEQQPGRHNIEPIPRNSPSVQPVAAAAAAFRTAAVEPRKDSVVVVHTVVAHHTSGCRKRGK